MLRRMQIFSNKAGEQLAQAMAQHLSIQLGKLIRKRFNDDEQFIQIDEDVRGNDVFVVIPTNPPAENFLEALFLIDALQQASAERITAVIPYSGYNRQDRKDRPRVSRSALVLAKAFRHSGINRALLLDLHSEATAGFYDQVIVDHIYGSKIIVPRLQQLMENVNFVIAAPDRGGAQRAQKYAEFLGQSDHVMFSKIRGTDGKVDQVKIIGDVTGKTVVLVDDIIDTGGTMVADAKAAMAAGATSVIAVATHGVLSSNAVQNIDKSPISHVIVTDTIDSTTEKVLLFKKTTVVVLSAAPLLAQAVRRIHEGQSVSELILRQ
jgi:ribose-phosphate pyrophosphokinase